MRGSLDRVVQSVNLPSLNITVIIVIIIIITSHYLSLSPDLPPDLDQSVTEPVQLRLVLALGGFDHQGPRHWPGHGGGVEAVVHQSLGDVHRLHPGRLLVVPHVDDELVGVKIAFTFVERLEVLAESE